MSASLSSSQAASYGLEGTSHRDAGLAMIDVLDIQKGSTILDLGCGTGALTKVLAEKVGAEGKVVAVDSDGERLKVAREEYSASNIEYVQANDKTFPATRLYDLVFCNDWNSDKSSLFSLFKSVYDSLRPGGQFAFIIMPAAGQKLKTHLLAEIYKKMASSAGFEITSVTTEDLRPKHRKVDHYIAAMYGWFDGQFDPAQFDSAAFQRLKREYGVGPVVQTEKLEFVLTKPIAL